MSRSRGETEGGVLSFSFLDVLSCTMGCLVLLVVIFGQRADNISLDEALKRKQVASSSLRASPELTPSQAAGSDSSTEVAVRFNADAATTQVVEMRLKELERAKGEVSALRSTAAQHLADEKARVAGIEEHERRLEHDLAKLHVVLSRLDEAESKQRVDQQSAEEQLARLEQIVLETQQELADLRKEPPKKKSYAIVPFKGAGGTDRRPIYIECTRQYVTIQPEGIRLTPQDFLGPIRSGNPLASAIRAATEELNARSRAAGIADPSAPYPLFIVRPDGASAYHLARQAVESWDAGFGYEFVDADWKLEYPASDVRLGQSMEHAVQVARERYATLVKAAPRRYGAAAGAPMGVRVDAGGSSRSMQGSSGGQHAQDGAFGGSGTEVGSSHSGRYANSGDRGSTGGNFADQFENSAESTATATREHGAAEADASIGDTLASIAAAESVQQGGRGANADDVTAESAAPVAGISEELNGSAGGAPGGTAPVGSAEPGGVGGSAVSGSAIATGAMGTPAPEGGQPGNAGGGTTEASPAQGGLVQAQVNSARGAESAAAKRGVNWANRAASLRSAPITRPIQVVVSRSQLAVTPERGSQPSTSAVVDFDQPTDDVLDGVAAAVKDRMEDWGFAGQGMYWRPTLVLQVTPGAERHATRLCELLADSGLDVRMEQVAARSTEDFGRAR